MLKHQPTSKAWKYILKLLNYEHKFKNCTSIPFHLARWKTWIFALVILMFCSPCMVIMLPKIIVIIAIFPSLSIINMASRKIILHFFFFYSLYFYQLPKMINELFLQRSDSLVLYSVSFFIWGKSVDLLSFRRAKFRTII